MLNWIKGHSNLLQPYVKWVTANPRKAFAVAITVGSPFINYLLQKKASRDLIGPAVRKIETGTRPSLPIMNTDKMIARTDLEKELFNLFHPSQGETFFGIVIGPSGTGKTMAIRNFCRLYPSAILYFEVREVNFFAEELAKEAGIKTKPTNVFDIMIGQLSNKYVHYLRLPNSSEIDKTAKVLHTLEEACLQYKQKYGVVPVLFLDATDLIAKCNKQLLISLITHAKFMANMNTLSIVFVSSEGSIMPLLKSVPGVNRATKIVEVNDIPDKDAVKYLMMGGIANSMAKKIVDFLGGRLVYLRSSIKLISVNKDSSLTEDELFEEVKNEMIALTLEQQKSVISNQQPYSGQILKEISKKEFVSPSQFGSLQDKKAFNEAIDEMIRGNVLRYNKMGMLTWHSKLTKNYFAV